MLYWVHCNVSIRIPKTSFKWIFIGDTFTFIQNSSPSNSTFLSASYIKNWNLFGPEMRLEFGKKNGNLIKKFFSLLFHCSNGVSNSNQTIYCIINRNNFCIKFSFTKHRPYDSFATSYHNSNWSV